MPLLLSNFKCKLEHEIHKYCNFLIHEGESYKTLEPLAFKTTHIVIFQNLFRRIVLKPYTPL